MYAVFAAMPDADPAHYVRGQYDGYRDDRRGRAGLDDRDLRGAAPGDRQLALVGRAVLHPHRQVPAGHADRAAAGLPAAAAARLPRRPGRARPSRARSSSGSTRRPGSGCSSRRSAAGSPTAEQFALDLEFAEQGGEGPTPYEVLLHAAMRGRQHPLHAAGQRRADLARARSRCSTPSHRGPAVREGELGPGGGRRAASRTTAAGTARGWGHEHADRSRSDGAQPMAAARDPERRGAVAVPADRRLRVPVGLPHRRAGRARRRDRLAVRAALRLAERVRHAARPRGRHVPARAVRHQPPRRRARTSRAPTRSSRPGRRRPAWVEVRDALTMGPRRGDDTITPHTRPPADDDAEHLLVRTVVCLEGSVGDRARLRAGVRLRARRRRSGRSSDDELPHGRRDAARGQTIRLRTDMALGIEGNRVRARHVAAAAASSCSARCRGPRAWPAPADVDDAIARLAATTRYWRELAGPRAASRTIAGATRSSARR